MEKATTTARRRVGYKPCSQKHPLFAYFEHNLRADHPLAPAFIFSMHSCSSLSRSSRQVCLGWHLFTERRQCFPMGSLIWAEVCLQVEPGHSLLRIEGAMPGEMDCHFVIMQLKESQIQINVCMIVLIL